MKLPPSYPLEDHLVVLPSEDQLLLLNSTARFAWEQIAQGGQRDAVARKYADMFDVSVEQARKDVQTVLDTADSLSFVPGDRDKDGGLEPPLDPEDFVSHRYLLAKKIVEVQYQSIKLERQLHPRFSHWESEGSEPEHSIAIWQDENGFQVVSSKSQMSFSGVRSSEAVGVLLRRMAECLYPDTKWLLMMHAGGVVIGDRCIVFPGNKGRGKSTLIAGLVAQGCSYMGDEFIPLDEKERACAFPLRLGLKAGSWPVLEKHFPQLQDLLSVSTRGLSVKYLEPSPSLPPGCRAKLTHLVFPKYRISGEPSFRELSPVDTLRQLIETQTWFTRDSDLIPRWINFLETVSAVEISYRSLREALDLLSESSLD